MKQANLEAATSVLNGEYDLTLRTPLHDRSYYRLTITQTPLDELGFDLAKSGIRGDFERFIEHIETDGKIRERITWKNVQYSVMNAISDYFQNPIKLSWADGYSYSLCIEEDDYASMIWPAQKFEGVPRDMLGYEFMLLTVDAHFEFDFFRSHLHGAIKDIRRVGDSVYIPDNGATLNLIFPPAVTECPMTCEDVRTHFLGLTVKGGGVCALLGFETSAAPFQMVTNVPGDLSQPDKLFRVAMDMSTTMYGGMIVIRLDDGSLQGGKYTEFVYTKDSESGQRCTVRVEYALQRIEAEEYENRC